ncbi:mitochondrial pyruvate carrier [Dipodascopsis tothii]|uniref:mitochondrial pyruvate carrier n=1 Tax=Dipodascopsis tothii TaxID=44089 RepID=UPI0034D0184B
MASKFQQFMVSETGPKTIHFWAPVMKWALVFAGISDLQRPVESLSGTQQIALFATGAIWTRWCLIIKPKNYLLASVNFFLGSVAAVQLSRVYMYHTSQGKTPAQAFQSLFAASQAKKEAAAIEASN